MLLSFNDKVDRSVRCEWGVVWTRPSVAPETPMRSDITRWNQHARGARSAMGKIRADSSKINRGASWRG